MFRARSPTFTQKKAKMSETFTKKIITEGTGAQPGKGQKVTVHALGEQLQVRLSSNNLSSDFHRASSLNEAILMFSLILISFKL